MNILHELIIFCMFRYEHALASIPVSKVNYSIIHHKNKRDSTLEEHIRIHDWLKSLISKRVNYLSCMQGNGGLKDIHCVAQNAALSVFL